MSPEEIETAKVKILTSLREGREIGLTLLSAGACVGTVAGWRKADPTFDELWREALGSTADLREQRRKAFTRGTVAQK